MKYEANVLISTTEISKLLVYYIVTSSYDISECKLVMVL